MASYSASNTTQKTENISFFYKSNFKQAIFILILKMSESDISGDHRYLMIYPIYFNVNRSLNYGRRLPKALCCIYFFINYSNIGEKPNISDVKNACDKLGLNYILQVFYLFIFVINRIKLTLKILEIQVVLQ